MPEVQLLGEPDGLQSQWEKYIDIGRSSPNSWTDAYLAAFAKCADLRLVTFDKGFSGFIGLEALILTADAAVSQTEPLP